MRDDRRVTELERSFRRAGLPTFIRGYSARQAFAKALPLLTVVFVLEILNALNFDFGLWTNVGFLAGGIAISLGIIGTLNLARGQRFLSVPRRVGLAEMVVFVAVPSVLPLLFGGQCEERRRHAGREHRFFSASCTWCWGSAPSPSSSGRDAGS